MANIFPRRTENVLITDKKKFILKRLLVCLLIVSLSLIVLSSCNKDKDGDLYEKIFSSENGEEVKNLAFDKYILVLPSDCSAEIYGGASALGERIEEKTAADTELIYDVETRKAEKGECEIIIGNTSRRESAEYLKSFKIDDFGYAYRDGVILIGGISDSAVLSAIDRFTSDVMVYADEEILMNHDAELFQSGKYDLEKATLCGFELWDYSIVYPRNDTVARLGAYRLRDAISESSGYYLAVRAENEVEADERAIRIGDTSLAGEVSCADTEAKIVPRTCGVSLVYGGDYGMDAAINKLLEGLLRVRADGCASLDIDEDICLAITSYRASVLDVSPADSTLGLDGIVNVVSAIHTAAPTFARVRGISEKSMEYIAANFAEDYSVIRISGGERGRYYLCRNGSIALSGSETVTADGVSVSRITYATSTEGLNISVIEVSVEDSSAAESAQAAARIVASMIDDSAGARVVVDSPFCGNAAVAFESGLAGMDRIENADVSYGYLYKNGSCVSVNDTNVSATDYATYLSSTVTFYK